MDDIKPVVTIVENDDSIVRTETKTLYLDKNKKLPIVQTATYWSGLWG
jgi:hypothetical protein